MSAVKNLSIRLSAVGGDKVRQEFKSLGADGDRAFRRITQVIQPANDNLKALDATARSFNEVIRQGTALFGAYLGFQGLKNTFSAIFSANTTFEKLSASLKTVTGSTEAAQEAFALIEKFAVDTPYQLNEIVEAFIRLQALGLDPSEEALTSYGNTASAFSRNMIDFVEAVADATVGEFERLKSFGIKANTLTDEVKFTFAGVTTTVKKNAADIEKYLRSLGDVQFAGAMDEQMKTMNGVLSNIEDSFEKLYRQVGQSGFFPAGGTCRCGAGFAGGTAWFIGNLGRIKSVASWNRICTGIYGRAFRFHQISGCRYCDDEQCFQTGGGTNGFDGNSRRCFERRFGSCRRTGGVGGFGRNGDL